MIGRI